MITYSDLEKLEDSCLKLLENCYSFSTYEDEERIIQAHRDLFHAIRKLTLATEFQNRQIISVSGLQGAGKSTMMKTFFGLPDGILNITNGRGEQIPIIISEHQECQSYETYAICLEHTNSGYERKEKKIKQEDFTRYSSGNIADENDIIYLELRLPYKRIEDPSLAFMLLPGFENKQDYWTELIEFSLKCSNSAIFVFDNKRYSRAENKTIINNLKDNFRESLIYAISRCDTDPKEICDAFRKKCIEELEVQEDRVINIGQYKDNSKNEKWITVLSNSILKYCNSSNIAISKTNDYLINIIQDDIVPQIALIKELLNKDNSQNIIEKIGRNDNLATFDKIKARRKKKLDKALKLHLNIAADQACKKLQKIYNENKYAKSQGVHENILSSVRRTVLGEKVKDKVFARKRLTVAITDYDGILYFQKAFAKALGSNLEEWLPENSKGAELINDGLNTCDEDYDRAMLIESRQKDLLHDAKLLLSKEYERGELLRISDLKKTCECIADLAENYFCVYTLHKMYAVNPKYLNDIELEKLQVDLKDTITKINTFDKFILGGLGITGIDLLEDGVLNAIPNIAASINVAVPVVAAATTAIAAVGAGCAIIKDINRLQLTEENAGEAKIREISKHIKQDYLDSYDDAMQIIRDQIERRIEEIQGNTSNAGRRINALGTINKLESQINDLRIELNAEANNLRNAFR